MSTYEQIRLMSVERLLGTRFVVPWISADVGHVNVNALTLPMQVLRQLAANLFAINVSEDTTQRLERLELIQDLHGPEIAGVPELIAVLKVLEDHLVKETVSVGKEPDLHLHNDTAQSAPLSIGVIAFNSGDATRRSNRQFQPVKCYVNGRETNAQIRGFRCGSEVNDARFALTPRWPSTPQPP